MGGIIAVRSSVICGDAAVPRTTGPDRNDRRRGFRRSSLSGGLLLLEGGGDVGADTAVGEVFSAASVGQLLGPLLVAPLAQLAGFRIAFLLLLGYALVAILALARHHRRTAVP